MLGKTIKKAKILKLMLVIVIATIFLVSMISCSKTSEERGVSGFDKVALYGKGDLIIEQGDTESLTIEAQSNLIKYIETTVSGGTLSISIPDKEGDRPPLQIGTPKYSLKVKDLDGITAYGEGDIDFSDFVTDTISITIAGSGTVILSGEAKSQVIEINGAGNYSAEDFETNECIVKINGSGNASVNVTDNLDITINGSGDVEYIGSPSVSHKQN